MKVKRLIQVPEETHNEVVLLAQQTGMTEDEIYSYLAARFFELPTSVIKEHMTDLFRRMSMKA